MTNIVLHSPTHFSLHNALARKHSIRVSAGIVVRNGIALNRHIGVNANYIVGGDIVNSSYRVDPCAIIRSTGLTTTYAVNPFTQLHPNTRLLRNTRINGFIRVGGTHLNGNSGTNRLACLNSTRVNSGIGVNTKAVAYGCSNTGGFGAVVNSSIFINSSARLITPMAMNGNTAVTTNAAIAHGINRGTLTVDHIPRARGRN